LKANKVFGGLNNVLNIDHAVFEISLEAKFLIDLVTSYPTEVVTFGILKESLEESFGICRGGWFAGTDALVDFLERFIFIACRILFETANDGTLVDRSIDNTNFRD